MDLHNRWGEPMDKEPGGLIGPDGQPLPPAQDPKPSEEEAAQPQLDFFNYVASLGFQAMIFLGEMPNPVTDQTEKNLKQAKFLIDTLVLIRDKTTGNLTKEESELLNGSVYELQKRFVEIAQKEPK
jgi:hypothetical protein